MSINEGSVSLSLTKTTRSWRTNIESTFGLTPFVSSHRQLLGVDNNQKVVTTEAAPIVERAITPELLSDATQVVTLKNGTTITLAEAVEAIPTFIDKWAAEDKAKAAAAEAARIAALAVASTPAPTPTPSA